MLNDYNPKDVSPLRYWVNRILPLVYDDSLSYYEVLAKISAKMNEVIEQLNANNEQVESVTNFTKQEIENLTLSFNNFQQSMLNRQKNFETKLLENEHTFETQLNGDIANWESETEEKFQNQYNNFLRDYKKNFGLTNVIGDSEALAVSQKGWTDLSIIYKGNPDAGDWNDLNKSGFYAMYSKNTNEPSLNYPVKGSGGFLIVFSNNYNNVLQIFYNLINKDTVYIRNYTNNKWSNWYDNNLITNIVQNFNNVNDYTVPSSKSINEYAYIFRGNIQPGEDYNDCIRLGTYVGGANANNPNPNKPAGAQIGILFVIGFRTGFIEQIFIDIVGNIFFRYRDINFKWYNWISGKIVAPTNKLGNSDSLVVTQALFTKSFPYVPLKQSEDWKNYTNSGYTVMTSASLVEDANPPDNAHGGSLMVFGNTLYLIQLYFDTASIDYDTVCYRIKADDKWSEWRKICHSPVSIYGNTDKTIQQDFYTISHMSNMVGIFNKIGVVGDSLASGQGRINNLDEYHDFYEFSWPQFMKRKLNNNVINFSKTGLTTRTWLSDTEGLTKAKIANNKCVCYIIGLGANDVLLGEEYLGNINDIKDDYNDNNDTYYGNYDKIIHELINIEKNCKIFTLTNPVYGGAIELRNKFNKAVIDISNKYDNVYPITLDFNLYNNSNDFIQKNLIHGHYTPAAYQYMSEYIMYKITEVIMNNPSDFYFTNLIGTDYTIPTI